MLILIRTTHMETRLWIAGVQKYNKSWGIYTMTNQVKATVHQHAYTHTLKITAEVLVHMQESKWFGRILSEWIKQGSN